MSLEAWLAWRYAAVLSLVVAYLLWNRSVKAVGGTRTAIYMCVTPLVRRGRRLAPAGRAAPPAPGGRGASIIVCC